MPAELSTAPAALAMAPLRARSAETPAVGLLVIPPRSPWTHHTDLWMGAVRLPFGHRRSGSRGFFGSRTRSGVRGVLDVPPAPRRTRVLV